MIAGMQTVLILQQRAVSDQHLAVRNPPLSQEVLHLENSPSLSSTFSTAKKKTTIPKSRIPTKPGTRKTVQIRKSPNFGRSDSCQKVDSSVKKVGSALSRFLWRMTISPSSYEEYYTRYAPRTHGLPTSVPLHDFPRGRDFYKKLGEPKKIVAPMVDQSELVYNLQVKC
jgi:hypothetical protein